LTVDFYPLISRAVARLERDTEEARAEIYEHALRTLETLCVDRSQAEFVRLHIALGQAIRRVEAEAAAASRPPSNPASSA
jgi:hypothetical protein